jgi:hypothetical protein
LIGELLSAITMADIGDIGDMVIYNFLLSCQTIVGWNHEVSSQKSKRIVLNCTTLLEQ